MFKLLRFHLLLLGIITCAVMEPMLVNANSDNGMVEQEELDIIIADRKCRAFKAEKCKCGKAICQEMTGFSAGTCCMDGYMLGCCGKLLVPPGCRSAANKCPCGFGTCIPHLGRVRGACCGADYSWKCCERPESEELKATKELHHLVTAKFGNGITTVQLDLLMQRNLLTIFGCG
ncbi:hypothetical protein GPALN_013246 [Globodera pallida]|nr:hypothetical protein GPALN_013246 [Globodera pallida]